MPGKRYVALIRGINVGGKNPVPMPELRAAFEGIGCTDVTTYIQSGNVLFSSTAAASSLESTIEAGLEQRFGVPLVVVVRSHAQLRAAIAKAPDGFGADPDMYYCDAVFLKAPLTSAKAMQVVKTRDGVDRAWPGARLVYFERLGALRTKSKLSAIVGTPEYKLMTIRSWATTTKLLSLLDQA
jgi:uncharacterized protein (DUF1697 family)